jgi:hypothetical protein
MSETEVAEIIETHILCSVTFFRKLCRLWDNVEKCGRAGQATDDNMAHAHWKLDKTTHTHTHKYLILTAFVLQQWSKERASMLRYTHTACLLVSFVRDDTCNYVCTPRSRALLKKLTGSQLSKKFPAFYGTRRFNTAFTSVRHLSLWWASSIHTCNSNFNGMCSSGLRMIRLD